MNPQSAKHSILLATLFMSALSVSACSSSDDSDAANGPIIIDTLDSVTNEVENMNVTTSPETDATQSPVNTELAGTPENESAQTPNNTDTANTPETPASTTDNEQTSEAPQPPAIAQASLEFVADKTVRLSWVNSNGAEFYRVLENPDGNSGYSQISDDLNATTSQYDHRVALFKRVNARYIVQSCNAQGCVDSAELLASGTLESAIGYFKASNTGGSNVDDVNSHGDNFGNAVALSADGNTLAIAAYGEDSLTTGINGDQSDNSAVLESRDSGSGAVYVFTRGAAGWQQQAYLKPSNTKANNALGSSSISEMEFGGAISISANGATLVVGASHEASAATGINGDETDQSAKSSGAVYVFERVDENWQQQAYVKASNSQRDDFFGGAVSISADGNSFAVGARFEDSAATGINSIQIDNSAQVSGAVYVFTRTNGLWQQQAYIKASNTDASDQFGATVSMSADGKVLAVGANGEASAATGINGNQSDNSFPRSGAVYIFAQLNDAWQQQAYIKASNTDQIDQFGTALSLSGDGKTLAVGAFAEASGLSGINNENQRDLSADFAGAAFVFVQNNGTWQQQAYIKASNTDAGDFFGSEVSLSANGDTLAISAIGEASISVGVNGDQSDNAANSSGATYVFTRSNANWQQQAYLKASNNRASDEAQFFGSSVSLSADGNDLAIGAQGESSGATGVNGDQNDVSASASGAAYLY